MHKTRVFTLLYVVITLLSGQLSAQEKEGKRKAAESPKTGKDDTKPSSRYQGFKKLGLEQDVNELLSEARALKEQNPKEALAKVENALGISLAEKDILNEGRCYLLLGEVNENIQEWKLALDNYNNAYEKLKRRYQKTTEFKEAIRGLAATNLRLGNHAVALALYQEALELPLTPSERSRTQLGISEVHYQMGNFTQALNTVEQIEPIATDDAASAAVDNQKAKIFSNTNEVEKAKDALLSSQNTIQNSRRASGNTIPSAPQRQEMEDLKEAKEEVAGALHEQKRFDEEIDLRNKSIEYNLESNNLPEVTRDKVSLSKAFAAKGETSEAIRELEEAALIADTIDDPKGQAKAYLALADIYEKNGRQNQALSAYKKFSNAVNETEQQQEQKLIEKADLIKQQKDIEELTKDVAIGQREETIAEATVFRQQLIIYGLVLIILITAVTSFFIYRNAKASKTANQLLALKSLRSQMNPHFIFNALNSVNQFIAQNDERTANKFLSEFSRLMRLVMENSQEDFIPLLKEQEIISLYLKLEHYRFRDKFDYDLKIDETINPETFEIPPMLLQPYIENAVWHGLRYKESKGHLLLHMRKNADGLEVEITDDGIGRKRSGELKTANQKRQTSTGLKNIEERLTIINKVYKAHYSVSIRDLDAASGNGTSVLIRIPEHKQNGKH
jgi:tetratricopeptide (TPR) repeat protein